MSHVTNLPDLLAEMSELVRVRAERIRRAEAEIIAANREFDSKALPLRRKIDALLPTEEANKPRKKASKSIEIYLEGMSEEDAEHYRQLSDKRR